MGRIQIWCCLTLCLVAGGAPVCAGTSGDRPVVAAEALIGREGVCYFRSSERGLTARPVDERSPLVLRISDAVTQGNTTIYELRFIGAREGKFDLRNYLVRADGTPLMKSADTQKASESLPIDSTILIRSTLPPSHAGDLTTTAAVPRTFVWPYRFTLQLAIVVWTAAVVWLLLRPLFHRRRIEAQAKAPPLTLADQLRPLVDAAVAGNLDPAGQARLERLLLTHWRQTLCLSGLDPVTALRRMQDDTHARALLRELEAWLHMRPGTQNVDVAALLSPYRGASPIALERTLSGAAKA